METRDSEFASSRWLSELRREFVRIASRRVDAADVEDVAQDALRVVAEKGLASGDTVTDTPALAWCFQVLRNTIGNHYQRQRTRRRWSGPGDPTAAAVDESVILEAMDSEQTLKLIETALEDMKHGNPKCADYLARLADGARAGDIADEESVERGAFYRRLYRCRQKLREMLSGRGLTV